MLKEPKRIIAEEPRNSAKSAFFQIQKHTVHDLLWITPSFFTVAPYYRNQFDQRIDSDHGTILVYTFKINLLCFFSFIYKKILFPHFVCIPCSGSLGKCLFFSHTLCPLNWKNGAENRNTSIPSLQICLVNLLVKSGIIFFQ